MNSCIVLLLCISVTVLVTGFQYPDDYLDKSCNCIPAEDCHSTSSKLKLNYRRSRVTHKAYTKYLGLISCGYNGSIPLVCCPNEIPEEVVKIVENKKLWMKYPEYKNVKKLKNAILRAKKHSNALPEEPSAKNGDSSESPAAVPQEPKIPYQFPGCGRYAWREDFGNATELGEYPWLALLEYDTPEDGKQLLCGGVLISDQHILTAAHCLTSRSNKLTSVILGEHDTNAILECVYQGPNHSPICVDSMRKFDVESTIVHENYNDGISHRDPLADDTGFSLHDIALIKLKTKVQLNPYLYPICLPTKAPIMKSFKVAGWGRSSVPGNKGLNLKLLSYLSVCSKSESDRREIEQIFNEKEHICAVAKQYYFNPCIADSGGPLMADERKDDGTGKITVYGISYVENSCYDYPGKPENLPGIFTNVYNYKDWIVKYMNV